MKSILNIDPLGCPSCACRVEKLLEEEMAILQVTVLPHLGKIRIAYDEKRLALSQIKDKLNKAGFPVLSEGRKKL